MTVPPSGLESELELVDPADDVSSSSSDSFRFRKVNKVS